MATAADELEGPAPNNGPRPARDRLDLVRQLYDATLPSPAIVEKVIARFGVNKRTVYKDIARIEVELEETNKRKRDQMRARRRASFEDLYRRSVAASDRRTAAICLDRLCKLDGLYAPTEVTVTPGPAGGTLADTVNRIKAMSPIDRQRELDKLAEKRQRLAVGGSAPKPQNVIDIGAPPGADERDDQTDDED